MEVLQRRLFVRSVNRDRQYRCNEHQVLLQEANLPPLVVGVSQSAQKHERRGDTYLQLSTPNLAGRR